MLERSPFGRVTSLQCRDAVHPRERADGRIVTRLLPALGLALLVACEPSAAPPTRAAEVVDSAGVRVVRSADAGFEREPDVVLADPIFRVGWDEMGLLLENVGAGRLRGHDILVADRGARRLYRLDPDGAVLDTIGRQGEGPGEFLDISGMALLAGDSILVEDPAIGRTSIFDPAGGFVRDEPRPRTGIGWAPAGTTSDGTLVWRVNSWAARFDVEDGWVDMPVLASRGGHAERDTVGDYRFIETVTIDGRPGYRPVPHTGLTAASGRGFVHVMTDEPWVHWYDVDTGELYQRLSWGQSRVPLDDERYDAYVETMVDLRQRRGAEADVIAAVRDRYASQRRLAPEFAPVLRDARSTSSGAVWLLGASERLMSPTSEYLLVGPEGGCLVRVRGENSFTVLDADERWVLGVERNALDVQALVLYEAPECPER